jgi:hypothetical protein
LPDERDRYYRAKAIYVYRLLVISLKKIHDTTEVDAGKPIEDKMCCTKSHTTIIMGSFITDIFKQSSGYDYNHSLKFVL